MNEFFYFNDIQVAIKNIDSMHLQLREMKEMIAHFIFRLLNTSEYESRVKDLVSLSTHYTDKENVSTFEVEKVQFFY